MASEDRFGYEWNKYSFVDTKHEYQFSQWVSPLEKKDFQNARVLDAGCGMGRNSYWAMKWGAKSVTAFDFDKRSVGAARTNLATFKDVSVLYKSFYEIEWDSNYDIAFSIGVIHHLEDPVRAIELLSNSVVPGGKVIIWVYSFEGNEWIVRYVDPIRKLFTSRLSPGLVHFLSYFASIPLWVFVNICKGPTPFLRQLSTYKFWHLHSIVFDQLIPTIAHYWKREEVLELFDKSKFTAIDIYRSPHAVGWTVCAVKK